jgi:hypothetical protein
MHTQNPLLRSVLACLLGILFIFGSPLRAQYSVPIELHAEAGMVGRTANVIESPNGAYQLGTFALSQAGSFGSDGSWNGQTYSVLSGVNFSWYQNENDPDPVWWVQVGTRVAAVTKAMLVEAQQGSDAGNGYVLPLHFTDSAGSGVPTVEVLMVSWWDDGSQSYTPDGHSFALVQPPISGPTPVLTPLSASSYEPITGTTVQGESFSWYRGSATLRPGIPFYVVDLTTGKRAPTGETHLGLTTWTDDFETAHPLVEANFYLHLQNWGYRFTLHYQLDGYPEMTQSLTASGTAIPGIITTTGAVVTGATYWLTRDADGVAMTEPQTAPSSAFTIHLESYDNPPPEEFVATEFYVARGVTPSYVYQPTANRGLSYVRSDVLVDYDQNANPHNFEYDVYVADLNNVQPFWLEIPTVGLMMGVQWYYAGWSPINGPSSPPPPAVTGTLSVTLPAGRALYHNLYVSSPAGAGPVSLGSYNQGTVLMPDPWHGGLWERTVFVSGSIEYSMPACTFSIVDNSTSESRDIYVGGGGINFDLSDWWLPTESLPLQISQSRWGHDLRLRIRNGEEYPVIPGGTQGNVTLLNGQGWYQSYYYFDATASHRTELDYWLYDATTDDESPWNQPNLIDWIALMPVKNVQATGIATRTIQLTWEIPDFADPTGMHDGGFFIERQSNGGGWTRFSVDAASAEDAGNPGHFVWNDVGAPLGTNHHYRVAYYYGSPPQLSPWAESGDVVFPPGVDWDGDGLVGGNDPNPLIPNPVAPTSITAAVPDVEANLSDPDRSTVAIRWESDGDFVSEFLIERRVDGGAWTELARVGAEARSYLDSGLLGGHGYEYRVTAIDQPEEAGSSASSPASEAATHDVPWLRKLRRRSSVVAASKASFFPAFVFPTKIVILDGMPFPLPDGPIPYYTTAATHIEDDDGIWTLDITKAVAATTASKSADYTYHYTVLSDVVDATWNYRSYAQADTNYYPRVTQSIETKNSSETYYPNSEDPSLSYFAVNEQSFNGSYELTAIPVTPVDSETFWTQGPQVTATGTSSSELAFSDVFNLSNGSKVPQDSFHSKAQADLTAAGSWMTTTTAGDPPETTTADVFAPPWRLAGDYHNVWDMPTPGVVTVQKSATSSALRYPQRILNGAEWVTSTTTLSGLYPTSTLISDTLAKFLPYSAGMADFALDPEAPFTNLLATGAEWRLESGETNFRCSKTRYGFSINASDSGEMAWLEIFRPTDDPATPADESQTPKILAVRSWKPQPGETDSPTFEIDPTTTNLGDGIYELLPLDVAPNPLRVNTDFQELKIDAATSFAMPDAADEDLTIAIGDDAGKITTKDLHEGFFGLRPGVLPPGFFTGATVTIKKVANIDPVTEQIEAGEMRIQVTQNLGEAGEYSWVVPFEDSEGADVNLVPLLYQAGASDDKTQYWLEGVKAGPITLEFKLVKGSDAPVTYRQHFMVTTVQSKADWQEEIRQQILLQTGWTVDMAGYAIANGFLTNRAYIQAIYAYYAQLFIQRPNTFLWPGLASQAGGPVWGGLSDAEYGQTVVPTWIFGASILSGAVALFMQDALMIGNRDIFDDLAWQFRAYEASGIWALEQTAYKGLDFPAKKELFLDPWVLIFLGEMGGDVTLIERGNLDLVDREQQYAVAGAWKKIHEEPLVPDWFLSNLAESPLANGASFKTLVPNGNITVFSDRMTWITDPTRGIWTQWMALSPSGRLGTVAAPGGVRLRAVPFSFFSKYFPLLYPIW